MAKCWSYLDQLGQGILFPGWVEVEEGFIDHTANAQLSWGYPELGNFNDLCDPSLIAVDKIVLVLQS